MAGNFVEPAKNLTLLLNELNCEERSNGNNNIKKLAHSASSGSSSIKMCPSSSSYQNKQFHAICTKAQAGQKLMILMRGPSGCGKSTLANTLLQQSHLLDLYQPHEFIYSTDDYFRTSRGYEFNLNLLSEAHEWNQQRVREKAASGWSPIIVDNTNIMVWEMQPYVQIAVRNGYILELMDPQTPWSKSASKMAQKNMLKETKYTVPLPQLRQYPPLPALPAPLPPPPAPPTVQNTNDYATDSDAFRLNANAQSWIPYEQNVSNYWSQQASQEQLPAPTAAATSCDKSILDLLRDESTNETAGKNNDVAESLTFQRHSVSCPNEPCAFILLRQMYPNKQLTGLWDLFVKCGGDVDWAVDILLKEDELNAETGSVFEAGLPLEEAEQFQCSCGKAGEEIKKSEEPASPASKALPKPQRQSRGKRSAVPATNKELQLQIENCFVLGDEQYSEHTRKIRDIRNGLLDQPLPAAVVDPPLTAPEDEEEDPEDNTLLEMDLGETLIEQLRTHFHYEGEMLPPNQQFTQTKVFMPRQLAKQMYLLWMEAVYNQLEEQRQQTLKDDEQFARLLKHPKYEECSESPRNVNELLDMELAWSIYNSEQLAAKQAAEQEPPNDIATHLTKMKLCEKFPEIPDDTVLEIFAATGSNYGKTVEVLDSNVQSELSGAELYEQAVREGEKLNAQAAREEQRPQQAPPRSSSASSSNRSSQLHEEAKCAALRDFEETRNLAAHHAQLKAECYLKAKQAVQQGNGSVALYYSEIAQLHKKKIDVFNHRAANCIMEVHKHTQNNPDLLDLHYLHTVEAISCLDLFLDRHITVLRNCTRVYKHVFIITGRGLHSANGVSTIKNKVKARLGERRLRWQEVNPGLLRVKVFSASRHAKNF